MLLLLFLLIIYGCETFYDIIGVYFGQNIELCNDFIEHWSVEILTHSVPRENSSIATWKHSPDSSQNNFSANSIVHLSSLPLPSSRDFFLLSRDSFATKDDDNTEERKIRNLDSLICFCFVCQRIFTIFEEFLKHFQASLEFHMVSWMFLIVFQSN